MINLDEWENLDEKQQKKLLEDSLSELISIHEKDHELCKSKNIQPLNNRKVELKNTIKKIIELER